MTNKFVRIIKDGYYKDYIPQDLIYNDLNKFKNWKCSAGTEGLFIDWDGNVYPATCEVGRSGYLLGSIKDDKPIRLLKNYIDCNHKYCPCLVEIYLPKYKTIIKELDEIAEGEIELDEFNAVTRASEFDRGRKYIMWAFGRKCNFSCSYCDDNSHSKLDSDLVELNHIKKTLAYANEFRQDKSLMWSFTGGEPTINTNFLALVKELYSINDVITVATNGSASNEYYLELSKYANINISVHFEFLKPEKLRRVSDTIISSNPHWFGLNFMIMPGTAKKTYDYISSLSTISNFKQKTTVHFDLLRKKNTSIYEIYSEEDIYMINKLKLGEY